MLAGVTLNFGGWTKSIVGTGAGAGGGGGATLISYIIVGGGGGGGSFGSGGGGGGVTTGSISTVSGTYPVVIGLGSAGNAITAGLVANSGTASSVFGFSAVGGGGGSNRSGSNTGVNGGFGASGGGGSPADGAPQGLGSVGITGQGRAGGNGGNFGWGGGGGGGAVTTGSHAVTNRGGNGGWGYNERVLTAVAAGAPFRNFSYSFNGTNQYLVLPADGNFGFGTGNFTIEMWFYPTSTKIAQALFDTRDNGQTSQTRFSLFLNNNTSMQPTLYVGGSVVITSNTAVAINQWYHIAVTRSGTTAYMFLNGVQVGTAANSSDVGLTASPVIGEVGDARGTFDGYFQGNIMNLRVNKGTALYTTAFSTSTVTALAPVDGTSVLTCNSATIVDLSNNRFTITNNGTVAATSATVIEPFAYYVGGGGGGCTYLSNGTGAGGPGGGGTGGDGVAGVAGTPNTGGGGGGGGYQVGTGGNGGSGLVVLSYPTARGSGTGGTISFWGTLTVHTFTTNTNFVFTAA